MIGRNEGDSRRSFLKARRVLVMMGAGALLLFIGILIGRWAADNDIRMKVMGFLAKLEREQEDDRHQTVTWHGLESSLHDLEVATIHLMPFETHGRGGAIEEIAGGILFASPTGRLGYLNEALEMHSVDAMVPLNWAGLEQSSFPATPGFLPHQFRVLDLLAIERGNGAFDLYVSHHRFEGDCIKVAVSRITLEVYEGNVRPDGEGWTSIFSAKPCMQPKTRGMAFEGDQSGGRMVLRDAQTLLLTIGDHQFNGADDTRAYSQDPNADLGKIIAIDLATNAARIYSSGHRNPQGLLAARDGTIWSTEHGPRGGDEINRIVDGADYGWPSVTYGLDYGGRDWAMNPEQGRHDQGTPPVFAFVPSIGISNLVQPAQAEFPLWRDHLLISSLQSGRRLFLARLEGERVAYVEPIALDVVARDMISLRDGRIAILSDTGDLVLVRNAERHDDRGRPLNVTAVGDEIKGLVEAPSEAVADWSGEKHFVYRCSSCHSLAGVQGAGPSLNGVVGRQIGGADGYAYSQALDRQTRSWTRDSLRDFLVDPAGTFPGTSMPATGISPGEAHALVDFLVSTSEEPAAP